MLLANLNDNPMFDYIPPAIQRAIKFLQETDFSTLNDGKHDLEGEEIFASVFSYVTKPREKLNAEVHKRYIDVQYLISGREIIGVGIESLKNRLVEGYSEEKDAAFYSEVKDEVEIPLLNGNYIVLFPGEIHRPGCNYGEEENIRKAVVKVSTGLLSKLKSN